MRGAACPRVHTAAVDPPQAVVWCVVGCNRAEAARLANHPSPHPPLHPQGHGGEGALLDELAAGGRLSVNPATQLVVTCELCRRPATKECWWGSTMNQGWGDQDAHYPIRSRAAGTADA